MNHSIQLILASLIVLFATLLYLCYFPKAEVHNQESKELLIAELASKLADATGYQQMSIQMGDSEDGRYIIITKVPSTVGSYRSFLIKIDGTVEEFEPE
jgi:hypothetical protein